MTFFVFSTFYFNFSFLEVSGCQKFFLLRRGSKNGIMKTVCPESLNVCSGKSLFQRTSGLTSGLQSKLTSVHTELTVLSDLCFSEKLWNHSRLLMPDPSLQ